MPASALASASAFSDHTATRIQGIVRTSAQLIVESRRLESGQPLLAAWLADAVTDVAMELIGRSLNGHPGRDDRGNP
ncbi:hypothetical protein B4Q13_24055 [Lacticaseibacillus rhamnosus]